MNKLISAGRSGIKNSQPYIILFSLVTLTFSVLYWKYIFSHYAYVYLDVGTDTYLSYYTRYFYTIKTIREGTFQLFDLSLGYGFSQILYLFFDFPFNIIASFFPEKHTHVSLLFSAFLKYLLIAFSAYKYYSLFSLKKHSKILISLLWCYSSFTVTWGQHLFSSGILYFTLNLFFIEKILRNQKGASFLFLLNIFFFISNIQNTLIFFSSTIFSIFYICAAAWLRKKNFVSILFLECKIGLLYIFAAALGAIPLCAVYESLTESTREVGAGFFSSIPLWTPNNIAEILTITFRFFGNNFNLLSSTYFLNYYEKPMLFISVLFFFGVVQIFIQKQIRKKFIALFITILLCAYVPFFNYLFTINGYRRWTFIIIFLMSFFIFYFIERDKVNKKGILWTYIALIPFLSILQYIAYKQGQNNAKYFIILILLTTSYCIFFYFSEKLKRRTFQGILTTLVFIEIVAVNYQTVNDRGELQLPLPYNFSRKNIIQQLQSENPDLFRAVFEFCPWSVSAPLLFGNFSLGMYDSFHPAVVTDFLTNNNLDYWRMSAGATFVYPSDIIANSLLGVKFLIASSAHKKIPGYSRFFPNYPMPQEIELFPHINTQSSFSTVNLDNNPEGEKNLFSPKGIDPQLIWKFIKPIEGGLQLQIDAEVSEENVFQLFYAGGDGIFSQKKSLCFKMFPEKSHYEIRVPSRYISGLRLDIEGNSSLLLQKIRLMVLQDGNENVYTLDTALPFGYTYFKQIDRSQFMALAKENKPQVLLHAFYTNKVIPENCSFQKYHHTDREADTDTSELLKVTLQNARMTDSTLTGFFDNNEEKCGLMVAPLFHTGRYTLKIDNKEQPYYKVNDGLVGFIAEPGKHIISLKWEPKLWRISLWIAFMAWGIYVSSICWFLWDRKKKILREKKCY